METDWGALVDKLLYQRGITQLQLAELLGVDPATVSRWKRNQEPSTIIQRQLKELLFEDSPMIDPELIKMLPNRVFIAHYENLTKFHAISDVLAADYGMTAEQALKKPTKEWVDQQVLAILHDVSNEPTWKSREAAGLSSVHKRSDGSKWKAIGLCFGDRRYLYVNIGNAILNLIRQYMVEARKSGHDMMPKVKLKSDSYKDANYGRIKYPVFEVTGWEKISTDMYPEDQLPESLQITAVSKKSKKAVSDLKEKVGAE